MAGVTFEDVINFKRFSNLSSLLPLVVYLPFGILMGILRLCIFFHVLLLFYVLPKKFPLKRAILRVMLTVTGIPMSVQGVPNVDNKKVIVANRVSNLDPFILALLCNNKMVMEDTVIKTKNPLLHQFLLPADENHDQVLVKLKENMNDSVEPLLFFPEKLKTNGKVSLLKFSDLPFELNSPIQPVTIQTSRFLFDISVSTFASSTVQDIFWCLVLPFTFFTIKYLPVTEKKAGESHAEFSSRVQSNMAKTMGLNASVYSHHDVIEYSKCRSLQQSEETVTSSAPKESTTLIASAPSTASTLPARLASLHEQRDEEIDAMVKQVKEVFPDFHSHGIISDLKQTRDVDATITNILEGKVPKEVSPPSSSPPSSNLSFKAKKFESNASGRQLSFEDRKKAMLEAARTKYKLKHGLL